MAEDKSFLSMYCRLCQAPRYRSTQPMGRTDQIRPELFKALDPESEPPTEGQPARCFLCQEMLVLLPDNKLAPVKKAEPVRRAVNSKELTEPAETFQGNDAGPTAPTLKERLQAAPVSGAVEVLFELGPNEEMKSFQDSSDFFLIVTNKRVLRIHKG